jgi:alkylation response protein AidB-like acyl-CoA dehydrogenase
MLHVDRAATLDAGRIGIAGQALGIGRAALEVAIEYAQVGLAGPYSFRLTLASYFGTSSRFVDVSLFHVSGVLTM